MVKRIGGFRRRTRDKCKKPLREKGKISVRKFLQQFKIGDKVTLALEPAYQKGMYHPRFHAKTGIVKKKNGTCYDIEINDLGKKKMLIVHPVHLRGA
jgi:large subunit ribosomal protein L21e